MDLKQNIVKEKVKTVKAYFELKSVTQTQRRFVIDFPGKNPRSKQTSRRLLRTFRETKSVVNANKGQSGRPRYGRTAINTENVRQCLEELQRKFTRSLLQETGLSTNTVKRILNTDLHLFPDRIQILQVQTETSREEKQTFCRNFSQRIENHFGIL